MDINCALLAGSMCIGAEERYADAVEFESRGIMHRVTINHWSVHVTDKLEGTRRPNGREK
jgi:hypothetical protein